MERGPARWLQIMVWLSMVFNFLSPELVGRAKEPHEFDHSEGRNVSALLAKLFHPDRYDNQLRPGFGGEAVEVKTDMLIRSMGPVSENEHIYSMDCYFRQTWMDSRLAFEYGDKEQLSLSIHILEKMWKPDTFFYNGKHSHLHTITVPNKLVRIKKDGRVIYSMRLTIVADCPMNLRKYPMDTQECPLYIASYGYTTEDVKYIWKYGSKSSVNREEDLTMAQFNLVSIRTWNLSEELPQGEASLLAVAFHLQRNIGYYMLQIYLPCYMLVMTSWVSFWINREATPARVTLSVTTLLTTSTIGLTGRDNIPKVEYATALDSFLFMCFVYVFAVVVEFAAVNYFTKTGGGDGRPPPPTTPPPPSPPPMEEQPKTKSKGKPKHLNPMWSRLINGTTTIDMQETEFDGDFENISWWRTLLHCFLGSTKYRNFKSRRRHPSGLNSVSKIDMGSRIVFPTSFLVLNFMYWLVYLYF